MLIERKVNVQLTLGTFDCVLDIGWVVLFWFIKPSRLALNYFGKILGYSFQVSIILYLLRITGDGSLPKWTYGPYC